MKIIIRYLVFVVSILGVISHASTFEDQFHERLMAVGWKQSLSELDQHSVDQRKYILGRALKAFSADLAPRDPSRQECLEIAQSQLLSMPGHAKYYQDKIESLRAEVFANAMLPVEEIERIRDSGKHPVDLGDYDRFRSSAFPVLSMLPSSETVAVLGHFIDDPVGRDGKNLLGQRMVGSDWQPFPQNYVAATAAIRNLGIENPPFPKPERYSLYDLSEGEADAWKDWWNEVKSGKRTYRFIGSPVEYGPDGPASKEVIERVERNRKRDQERNASHRRSAEITETDSPAKSSTSQLSIAGLLAAFALCGAAVWYFWKGRKYHDKRWASG